MELLKELKYEHMVIPERHSDKTEHSLTDPNTPDHSVNSSVSDADMKPDCRVKIVKVTNVYKVAYLKHYIKQKRLRRANKQALLKKKVCNSYQPFITFYECKSCLDLTDLSIFLSDIFRWRV